MPKKKRMEAKMPPPSVWGRAGVMLMQIANHFCDLLRSDYKDIHISIMLVDRNGSIIMSRPNNGCSDSALQCMKESLSERLADTLDDNKKVLVLELLKSNEENGEELPVEFRGLLIEEEQYRLFFCATGFGCSYQKIQRALHGDYKHLDGSARTLAEALNICTMFYCYTNGIKLLMLALERLTETFRPK